MWAGDARGHLPWEGLSDCGHISFQVVSVTVPGKTPGEEPESGKVYDTHLGL